MKTPPQTPHATIHKSFTLERAYPQSPARVFAAFSDPTKKRRWFAEGEGFVVDDYSFDFRVGGFERCRFRFGDDGPPMTNDTVYLDIIEGLRLVYAYSMTIGGGPLSASLASIELVAAATGTRLLLTEHTTFLDGTDGSEGRREGTRGLLDTLAGELDRHP